jgi:sortase A
LPPVDIPPVLSAGSPQPAKPVTRIVIPALELDTPVLLAPIRENTWDVSHLEQEVGHLEGTASVGVASNVVLAGHVTLAPDGRDGPFIALSQIEPGTVVTVYHGEEAFTYQIETLRSVKPTDIEVTFPTTEARLTLITCLNYDPELGRYSDRLVAVGRLLP